MQSPVFMTSPSKKSRADKCWSWQLHYDIPLSPLHQGQTLGTTGSCWLLLLWFQSLFSIPDPTSYRANTWGGVTVCQVYNLCNVWFPISVSMCLDAGWATLEPATRPIKIRCTASSPCCCCLLPANWWWCSCILHQAGAKLFLISAANIIHKNNLNPPRYYLLNI